MKRVFMIGIACMFMACGPKENNSSRHIETSALAYRQDATEFEGFVAYPKKQDKKYAAVLVIHDWDGLDEYEQMRARMLAENGYFAFAMDLYGKGIRAKDHKEAAEFSGAYGKDRKLLRSRIETALAVLKTRKEIDPSKIAIIGYCFGGLAAIEGALMGADIKGVATFHAALSFPTIAADAKNVKAPVLIHHGGADNFIAEKDIRALKSVFDKSKVPYRFIVHDGATHGFTLRTNQGQHMGMKYDAKADLASWASLLSFLRTNLR